MRRLDGLAKNRHNGAVGFRRAVSTIAWRRAGSSPGRLSGFGTIGASGGASGLVDTFSW
jgi:hypothetical protein